MNYIHLPENKNSVLWSTTTNDLIRITKLFSSLVRTVVII